MDSWQIDGPRLRALREEAELRAVDLAAQIGCHHNHYRKFERGTAQPSAVLARALLRVLTQRAGRPIALDDIARPVPSRRASRAAA